MGSARSQATTIPMGVAAAAAATSNKSNPAGRDSGVVVSPTYLQLLHEEQQRRNGGSANSSVASSANGRIGGGSGGGRGDSVNSGSTMYSTARCTYEMPVPLEHARCMCASIEGTTPYQNLKTNHVCPVGRAPMAEPESPPQLRPPPPQPLLSSPAPLEKEEEEEEAAPPDEPKQLPEVATLPTSTSQAPDQNETENASEA
jgi:hypothetical protein